MVIGEEVGQFFSHVWRPHDPLIGKAILYPESEMDVSVILKLCQEYNQPIVTHGGLTNLVASTKTSEDDIILAMSQMNKILEIDPHSRTMTVESGVVLEDVLQSAEDHGMFFPVNYGAKGSAQLGGAVSTNAGGTRVIRYGMMREQVLGMEAVLADGTLVTSLKKIIKDNTGLDWKHILIGTEGIFGVITKLVLRLVERPLSRESAIIAVDNYEDVVTLLKGIDQDLGGKLSAFEIMWQNTYKALTSYPSVHRPPLNQEYPYYVLIEYLGGKSDIDSSLLSDILVPYLEKSLIIDAAIATSHNDLDWFWGIREDVQPLLSYGPYHQTFDISIPIPMIGPIANESIALIKGCDSVIECFTLGHVGDGNIHYIVLKDSDDPTITDKINEIVYGPLSKVNGSISAEHGIGVDKKSYLNVSRSIQEIQFMKKIKAVIDPQNILNRGKVIP